jgi:hypothetical protein
MIIVMPPCQFGQVASLLAGQLGTQPATIARCGHYICGNAVTCNGYTHVKIDDKWRAISRFTVRRHGGNNAGSQRRVRPRHAAQRNRAEKAGVLRRPASRLLPSMAFVVNLPRDGLLRIQAREDLQQITTSSKE